jgi:Zinc-binding dehydrogenase
LQAHGGADVAVGLAVSDQSFAAAYAGLRRGGRLVLVALPADGTLSLPVFDTVLNGKSVLGSIVGTRADLDDVFALHAAGRTRVIYETRPLSGVNEAIEEVLGGKARARLVLHPWQALVAAPAHGFRPGERPGGHSAGPPPRVRSWRGRPEFAGVAGGEPGFPPAATALAA